MTVATQRRVAADGLEAIFGHKDGAKGSRVVPESSINVASQPSLSSLRIAPDMSAYEWATPEPTHKERVCFNVLLISRKKVLFYLDEDGISLHHEDNLRKTWIPYSILKEVKTNSWDTTRVLIKTTKREFTIYTRVNECHLLSKAVQHKLKLYKKSKKALAEAGRPSQDVEEMPAPTIFAITGRMTKWWEHPAEEPLTIAPRPHRAA